MYLTKKFKNLVKARGVLSYWLLCLGVVLVVWCTWDGSGEEAEPLPAHLRRYLRFPRGYALPPTTREQLELEQLMRNIEKSNLSPEVRNREIYGPVGANTTVIAVQVHKDVERLQHLVVSLAQTRYIHLALLVFSHSYYDERINELIESISFCRVMQIFYPYSVQLHPNSFPGQDPNDGRERDARRAGHKLHWWWKAHYVFSMKPTSSERVVIFLEESDYVLPDLLHVLRYLRRMQTSPPYAEVMALGKDQAGGSEYDAILLDPWSPRYDRGVAFDASTWRRIAANASLYCGHRECSWSRSLARVFAAWGGGAQAVTCVAARVAGAGAFASGAAAGRWAREQARRGRLFPAALRAVVLVVGAGGRVRRLPPPPPRAGWSDRRDRSLCMEIIRTDISEPTSSASIIQYTGPI